MNAPTESTPELIADFVDEATDSLRGLPEQLKAFGKHPEIADPIDAVFRAVHSIKGCAGFLGLGAIKTFAHSLENTMDEVRKGKVALNNELQRLLIDGFDVLDDQLQSTADGQVLSEPRPQDAELLQEIERLATICRVEIDREDALWQDLAKLADDLSVVSSSDSDDWSSRIRTLIQEHQPEDGATDTEADIEANTEAESAVPVDAASFHGGSYLCANEDVSPRVEQLLKPFLAMDRGEFDEAVGLELLEAAESFAVWAIEKQQPQLAEGLQAAAADFRSLRDSPLDIDPMLLSIVWDRLLPLLSPLRISQDTPPESVTQADKPAPQGNVAETGAAKKKARMVRIKEERVDDFLNDVARLFITCELFKDLQSRMSDSGKLSSLVEEMRQINHAFVAQSTALQTSVVALRRVSAATLFAKFPRMARSLATELGKQIEVHLSGEEVEIDKTLVDDLDSPLTHMIRNVVDHAIETPQERRQRGVSETGNLYLKAELTRTHAVITVRDDGRGIDPNILRNKIVEKKIMTRAQADALSDQQAIELVFNAGFSTAKVVSDISGRGVGMDVVRSTLREHNGDVLVESTVGEGTTFRLEIPIREAVLVIDGLVLRQADETFIVPFEHVLEITELQTGDLKPVHGSRVAVIRGTTHDAVSLSKILGLEKDRSHEPGNISGVLVGGKLGKMCLLVDEVIGHRQIVVNGINDILPGTDKIAGVAQLGGGRLALVLSVERIIEQTFAG